MAARPTVVVGGGIAGASVAYHLAARGRPVALLEQAVVGGGTTHHAAGMVARIRPSRLLTDLTVASAELYARLEAETGVPTGWRRCGSLMLARTEERLVSLRRLANLGRLWAIAVDELTPVECEAFWPGIRTDDLVGGLWIPDDGKVDPLATARSLAEGARRHGADVREDARVVRLVRSGSRITGVELEAGVIEADQVVLAAGMWSRDLAATVGVAVPLHAVEHHYVHLGPVPGCHDGLPCMRDYDAGLYFRPDGDGLWLGAFQERSRPWVEHPPGEFSMALLEPDRPAFERPLRDGVHRLPALGGAPEIRFVNGPESFTADDLAFLGAPAGTEGLLVLAGYNSFGIALSGGAGELVARWVEADRRPRDQWILDPTRMLPFQDAPAYLQARTAETLGIAYEMPWPNRQLETARGVRRSPWHERWLERGAVLGQRAGWERPLWFARDGRPPRLAYGWGRTPAFADVAVEARAARQGIAVFDQTSFAKLEIRGPDATAALGWLCTADMDVPVGRVVYTAMCDEDGRFLSDLTFTRLADDAWLAVTAAAQQVHDLDVIRRGLAGRRAEVVDVTSGLGTLGLMGPGSRDVLAAVTGEDLAATAFPFLHARRLPIGPVVALALRVSYVGELGYELHVPTEQAAALWEVLAPALDAAGAEPAGYVAMDALRLEKGFGAWGTDLSADDTVLEAGMGFLCAWDKPGGFRGREALLAQRAAGIGRRLVTVTLDDPEPVLWGGEVLLRDGRPVADLTSGGYGHTIRAGIGMAYVPWDGGVAAGMWAVDTGSALVPARVHVRAPWDPGGARLRG
ncbi:MAG TPA: FAD-dependent oxidoreductase [Candidatus Limnocylindrales bacterium]|nr:FAD-dependent oxidoreductase [Candidatus Limnocylindrales bacterium]